MKAGSGSGMLWEASSITSAPDGAAPLLLSSGWPTIGWAGLQPAAREALAAAAAITSMGLGGAGCPSSGCAAFSSFHARITTCMRACGWPRVEGFSSFIFRETKLHLASCIGESRRGGRGPAGGFGGWAARWALYAQKCALHEAHRSGVSGCTRRTLSRALHVGQACKYHSSATPHASACAAGPMVP
eukprot:scaffold8504_cov83-Phaeocystis_antarctica.AAC.1